MKAVFCNQCHREWLDTFHPGLLSEADLNRETIASGIYFIPGIYRICSHRMTEKTTIVARTINSLLHKIGSQEKALTYTEHKAVQYGAA